MPYVQKVIMLSISNLPDVGIYLPDIDIWNRYLYLYATGPKINTKIYLYSYYGMHFPFYT